VFPGAEIVLKAFLLAVTAFKSCAKDKLWIATSGQHRAACAPSIGRENAELRETPHSCAKAFHYCAQAAARD
jgi:hypothetical protein